MLKQIGTALYEQMLRIRYFEEKVAEFYTEGKIPGFTHLYVGQEAIAVGVCSNLRKEDYIFSSHRGHGHCIAKGAKYDRMMAELFGKSSGYCKGKGGSAHIASFEDGMYGASAIVGDEVPLAAGAALSIKLRGTDQVAVSFFGDGAVNTGAFHEGINLAAVWKLPVIFVCENNLYAGYTKQSDAQLVRDIADMAVAYGIPGMIVNGNDVIEVYKCSRKMINNARIGEGPALMECKTYRWRGHGETDIVHTQYRTKKELEYWMKNCPILKLEKKLVKDKILDSDIINKIKNKILEDLEKAVEFAENSSYPLESDILKGVFTE